MAIFNEILTGALSNVLARRLGMQVGSPAPALAPEIMPTLTLESDRPEWKFLAGERLCGGHGFATAVAAQHSFVCLTNPANSNTLIVVESVRVEAGAGSTVRTSIRPIQATGTPVNTSSRDSRWFNSTSGPFAGAGRITQGNFPVTPPEPPCFVQSQNTTHEQRDGYIVTPGWELTVWCNTVNVTLPMVDFTWRERAIVPGEILRV